MTPRFATLLAAAALLAAPALAQPKAGQSPLPSGGAPTPAFNPGAADWSCRAGRCAYALAPHAASHGWSRCFTSWFPTWGGWRKQNVCH